MRRSFLFLMVVAGGCLGLTGCIGGLVGGLLTEVGLSLVSTLLAAVIGSVIPTAAV